MPPSIGRSPRKRDCGLFLLAMNVINNVINYATDKIIDIFEMELSKGSEIFRETNGQFLYPIKKEAIRLFWKRFN